MPKRYEFYPAADDSIAALSGTYATAATGGGTWAVETVEVNNHGQAEFFGYQVHQSFYSFNTAIIPDSATVLSAVFSVYPISLNSQTDTFRLRTVSWTPPLDSTEFVSATGLSALTLLASRDVTVRPYILNMYNDYESTANFPAAINVSGTTKFMISGSKQETQTPPTVGVFETAGVGDLDLGIPAKLIVYTDENVLDPSAFPNTTLSLR